VAILNRSMELKQNQALQKKLELEAKFEQMKRNAQREEEMSRIAFKKREALAEEKRKKFERDREEEREVNAKKAQLRQEYIELTQKQN